MSTEKEHGRYKPHYLYQTSNMNWWIGDEYGKEDGLLKNEMNTTGGPSDVPLSNWLVKDVDTWEIDPTIKITSGPLNPSCKTIKIEVAGPAAELHSTRTGVYHLSKRWFNGHPIYQQDHGQLLHKMNYNQFWGVAVQLDYYGIRGSPGYLCPSKITKWEYWDRSSWNLGNITVTCSEHQ